MAEQARQRMTDWPHHNRLLGSTGDDRFLRPDLRQSGRRAQARSSRAAGHREAARSVLDRAEHGGRITGSQEIGNVTLLMVATAANRQPTR
jgi:hypothetical protein